MLLLILFHNQSTPNKWFLNYGFMHTYETKLVNDTKYIEKMQKRVLISSTSIVIDKSMFISNNEHMGPNMFANNA